MPIGLNEVIDRGVSTALQRRLGLSALATVALMPELAPTIDLGPQPEILYNLGWRQYQHSMSLAAVAAARAHVRFSVRTDPFTTALVVLEGIYVEGNGTSNFVFVDLLGSSVTPLTNQFPNHQARDFRQNNAGGSLTNGSAVILSSVVDGTAPTLGVFFQGTVPSGLTSLSPMPIPGIDGVCLIKNMGVEVDFNGLNAPAIVTFKWRERVTNDAELAA
jgi:hypothetical protein